VPVTLADRNDLIPGRHVHAPDCEGAPSTVVERERETLFDHREQAGDPL
jgi:hypothetical protein